MMRVIIVIVIAFVAITAMYRGPFKPLPTSAMPAVNIPF
jgi:hypothetical protein